MPGATSWTSYQTDGQGNHICGSFARIGRPVSLFLPETAQAFDPPERGNSPRFRRREAKPSHTTDAGTGGFAAAGPEPGTITGESEGIRGSSSANFCGGRRRAIL